jgi:hypothetical protein
MRNKHWEGEHTPLSTMLRLHSTVAGSQTEMHWWPLPIAATRNKDTFLPARLFRPPMPYRRVQLQSSVTTGKMMCINERARTIHLSQPSGLHWTGLNTRAPVYWSQLHPEPLPTHAPTLPSPFHLVSPKRRRH